MVININSNYPTIKYFSFYENLQNLSYGKIKTEKIILHNFKNDMGIYEFLVKNYFPEPEYYILSYDTDQIIKWCLENKIKYSLIDLHIEYDNYETRTIIINFHSYNNWFKFKKYLLDENNLLWLIKAKIDDE